MPARTFMLRKVRTPELPFRGQKDRGSGRGPRAEGLVSTHKSSWDKLCSLMSPG